MGLSEMMRTRTNSEGTNHNTICYYLHNSQTPHHNISHLPAALSPNNNKQIIAPPALHGNTFHHIQKETRGVLATQADLL